MPESWFSVVKQSPGFLKSRDCPDHLLPSGRVLRTSTSDELGDFSGKRRTRRENNSVSGL